MVHGSDTNKPHVGEVVDLSFDSDDDEEKKVASLHAVWKVRKLRVGNAYSQSSGSNKGKPWKEIRSEQDLHFCMKVDSNKGKARMNFSGNVPTEITDNQEHFDKLLSDNHATSADVAGRGECANTKHILSRINGTVKFPPKGPTPTVAIIAGGSQTVTTGVYNLLDKKYLRQSIIDKVLNLRFYDGDFVIVILPVDRHGLATIFTYSHQRNCTRENGKTGQVAADLMEAFPQN